MDLWWTVGMIEKLVNIAARDFGFPHYITQQDLRDKLNLVFREVFGIDAESYYDFYHEPFFHSALAANVKEKKCLLLSEDASSLRKVGENIRIDLAYEVKEKPWSETPLAELDAGRRPARRKQDKNLTLW
jgi:hypothetical protein